MEDLIKRKGVKGSQSKKKWRKDIDVSGLLEERAKQHKQQLQQEYNLKHPQTLVVEDTQKRKREQLDPDRFKKKPIDPKLQSKYEAKMIDRLNRKPASQPTPMEIEDNLFDPWAESTGGADSVFKKREDPKAVKVPAIVMPIGGESYNPKAEDFQQMVDDIIEVQTKKPQEPRPPKIKRIRKVIPKARNKIMRNEQLEAIRKKKQRQMEHQMMHLKTLGKEADRQLEKQQQTKRRNQQKALKLREEMKTGRIKRGPKLAKQRYTYKQDIIPDLEAVPLSKQAFREQVIRDRFDSVFRRGIFEPKKYAVQTNLTKNIKVKKRQFETQS